MSDSADFSAFEAAFEAQFAETDSDIQMRMCLMDAMNLKRQAEANELPPASAIDSNTLAKAIDISADQVSRIRSYRRKMRLWVYGAAGAAMGIGTGHALASGTETFGRNVLFSAALMGTIVATGEISLRRLENPRLRTVIYGQMMMNWAQEDQASEA